MTRLSVVLVVLFVCVHGGEQSGLVTKFNVNKEDTQKVLDKAYAECQDGHVKKPQERLD